MLVESFNDDSGYADRWIDQRDRERLQREKKKKKMDVQLDCCKGASNYNDPKILVLIKIL